MFRRILYAVRRRWRTRRALRTARSDSLRNASRRPVERVLVICYGNIYRSPFVAACLRRDLPAQVEVRSAGFHKKSGRSSPERHVAMCASRGIDLQSHRSSVVAAVDLAWADLIVLMDRHNWSALNELGASADKLVWLGAFADDSLEVADPYNLDDAKAGAVIDQMVQASAELTAKLR